MGDSIRSLVEGTEVKKRPLAVAILGAGAAGLCMAIKLREAGIGDFTIFEKAASVGGTWRDNTYPGSGCDVPSMLYSFSFEPKPDWSRKFAPQPEIVEYFEGVARKYDLLPRIRFNTEITEARFDEAAALWRLRAASGEEFEANVLISGVGQLNRPAMPKIEGLNDFKGVAFHSARWNHDADLAGKRVGVIGNGASAIQFVPEIAPQVGRLTIFRRTPNWCVPKPDRPYTEREKALFRAFPWLVKLQRYLTYLTLERNYLAFVQGSWFGKLFERASLKEMESHIKDPALRKKLTPDYPAGCKRILLTNDWYPALARDNVHVETSHISRIAADAIVTEDGVAHPVDAIIFATGFESTDFLAPMKVVGRGNVDLNDAWAEGAEAHRGVAVAGFPNFFMLYGPNTNLGHNSIIFMIECQANYIAQLAGALQNSRLRYLDVRKEAMESFNRTLQRDMQKTVWAAGCSSWYKTAEGKVTNNWSSFTARYWWEMRHPDFAEYALVG
ncbi:putative flavin-binding monooxygenase [Parvibaculum lavamentivorans DS-1]|uniref:Putative flavin-binding monooxygenase n=1 Tax=Parvibaculum lavamentivorans (strain DS-1 / DSM 13023 / NCIMB 13966) TaxID=402881 RepID=A7HRR7_PARL1|nr:NAD(P)/FAD-dependent oxidoreductase [Parvibaculum lavamentivorans]ABS62600.1 putative flavin-binding monooxygenase [Parvibaculum lavamentivorans DS-1]